MGVFTFTSTIFLSGCKTPITVISDPPGAKAFAGPFGGPTMTVDPYEEAWRTKFIGYTPVTARSYNTWNEYGHAWAWVEWPDGTRSIMKVRKGGGANTPATFEFNEATEQYSSQPNQYQSPVSTPPPSNNNADQNCFLTTACVRALGLPDNCHELTVLRNFRDNYLMRSTSGRAAVEHYYRIAPEIVSAICRSISPNAEYLSIHENLVRPSMKFVEAGRFEEAFSHYRKFVINLAERFDVARISAIS